MKNLRIRKGIVCLAVALSICSCKKFVQIDPPLTQAELSKIFVDDQTATSAVVGLYVQMMATNLTFCNGGYTLYNALYADELVNAATNVTNDPFRNNSLEATNPTVLGTLWTGSYRNIYQANAVLEGLNASTTLTPSVKRQLQGEMLYVRSLQYFYMINVFGAVPLELSTDYETNSKISRTNTAEIYKQVTSDLLLAKDLLSDSYGTSTSTRPNKGAATALLAKIYLYQENWIAAEDQCTEIINSGKYSLETLDNVFLATSKEVLFQISKSNGNTSEGSNFLPTSATVRPTYLLTNFLLDSFDPGDNRKTAWIRSNTVTGTTYYYPYKYKVRAATPITEFYVVQRLSEIYLIRAEARAQRDNLSGAIADIDVIRRRAGLVNALLANTNPGMSKSNLLNAVLKERQTELFVEWGNRFLDLKRMGKADEVLGVRKAPYWQTTDKLFPIPYAQIQVNASLTQNEGYTN